MRSEETGEELGLDIIPAFDGTDYHRAIVYLYEHINDPGISSLLLQARDGDDPLLDYISREMFSWQNDGTMLFNPHNSTILKILFDIEIGNKVHVKDLNLLQRAIATGEIVDHSDAGEEKRFTAQEKVIFSLALANYNLKSKQKNSRATIRISDIKSSLDQAFESLSQYALIVDAARNQGVATRVRLSKLCHYFITDYLQLAIYAKDIVIWGEFIEVLRKIETLLGRPIERAFQTDIIDGLKEHALPLTVALDVETVERREAAMIKQYLQEKESASLSIPELLDQAEALLDEQRYDAAVAHYSQTFQIALSRNPINSAQVIHCFIAVLDCVHYKDARDGILNFLRNEDLLNQFSQIINFEERKRLINNCLDRLDELTPYNELYDEVKSFIIMLISDISFIRPDKLSDLRQNDENIDDFNKFMLLISLASNQKFKNNFEKDDPLFYQLIAILQTQYFVTSPNSEKSQSAKKRIYSEMESLRLDLFDCRYSYFTDNRIEKFDPSKKNYYRLYSFVCYRMAKLIEERKVETSGLYSKDYLICAAVLGDLHACHELSTTYQAEGSWGRAILMQLATYTNPSDARRYLESTRDLEKFQTIGNDRLKKRKNFCSYLLSLSDSQLPYGALTFSRFLTLARNDFFGTYSVFGLSFYLQMNKTAISIKIDLRSAKFFIRDYNGSAPFLDGMAKHYQDAQQSKHQQQPQQLTSFQETPISSSARNPLSEITPKAVPSAPQRGEDEHAAIIAASADAQQTGEEEEEGALPPLDRDDKKPQDLEPGQVIVSSNAAPPFPGLFDHRAGQGGIGFAGLNAGDVQQLKEEKEQKEEGRRGIDIGDLFRQVPPLQRRSSGEMEEGEPQQLAVLTNP